MNTKFQGNLTDEIAATTYLGPYFNKEGIGLHTLIDITVRDGTTTLTATIEGYDPKQDKAWTLLASTALNAVGSTVLKVFPGSTVTANAAANDIIPEYFRIKCVIANGAAAVKAAGNVNPTGNDNALTYTAVTAGVAGNAITVTYVNPGAANAALSIGVVGTAITVNLATSGASAITSTAAQIKTAINAHAAASLLVVATNLSDTGTAGTGVVTAMTATTLTSGADPVGITAAINTSLIG